MAKTRRSPDGIFATPGAVHQHGGKLPIYICNDCEREVVWAESAKTGRKYLANISKGYHGQRFYIGANLHKCDEPAPVVDNSDIEAAIEDEQAAEYDLWQDDQYRSHEAGIVKAAYATREAVKEERSSYYDTTTYRVITDVCPRRVREVLSDRDGHSMYAYGSFGGYSTIGHVTADPEVPGAVLVESVYHIGD